MFGCSPRSSQMLKEGKDMHFSEWTLASDAFRQLNAKMKIVPMHLGNAKKAKVYTLHHLLKTIDSEKVVVFFFKSEDNPN